MFSYPSGMSVSSRAVNMLVEALRHNRRERGTRWRSLDPGEQALLVLAYLRKGETYVDLAGGFGIGVTTVFRYVREALTNQKAVNSAHARLRGPGERANAQLTSWKILRRIRACPHHTTRLINAIQTLIHTS